jgi:flagellar basal body-associated protein FliL
MMDEKTFRQAGDGHDDDQPGAQVGTQLIMGRSSIPRKILLGAVAAMTALIGVVLTLYVIQPDRTGDNAESGLTEQTAVNQPSLLDMMIGDSHDQAEHEGPVYTVDNIVVNPAGTEGTRFLSASFGFELESQDQAERFEFREPIIRDALIMILSSKTIDQLTDQSQKEAIREEIRNRVAGILSPDRSDDGKLAGVYYIDFVLQ